MVASPRLTQILEHSALLVRANFNAMPRRRPAAARPEPNVIAGNRRRRAVAPLFGRQPADARANRHRVVDEAD